MKEVRLLAPSGNRITVVGFNLHNWTTPKEALLNQELGEVRFHYLEAGRQPFMPWLYASLVEKASRLIQPMLPSNTRIAAFALSKRSWSLLQWVKKNRKRYDLIIAHNPPAFYSAVWLAAKTSSPYALDVEDYHPGEGSNGAEQRSAALLMRRFLEKASYVSFASPLIKTYSQRLLGLEDKESFLVVNNTFPHAGFRQPAVIDPTDKLRIVWFSQFVDYGRGLEKILPVLDKFRNEIELTLIGSTRQAFLDKEVKGRDYIRSFDSLPQTALHRELSNYDIGLALEDGSIDLNRNICLTNKIWSYLLAGLYIVATDTEAQCHFLEEYTGHGVNTSLSEDIFTAAIARLIKDRETIRASGISRFEKAAAAGWEKESVILLRQWQKILKSPFTIPLS